jgi:hypothetical protein
LHVWQCIDLLRFQLRQGQDFGIEFSTTYRDKGLSAYANLSFTRARGKTVETGQFTKTF